MSVEFPLTQGKVAIVSDEDADLAGLRWFYYPRMKKNRSYEHAGRIDYSGNKPKMLFLNRIVLERVLGRALVKADRTEYLDGNRLNCQRENIRPSTAAHRQQKESNRVDNTSGYRGVYFQKNARMWHAQIHAKEAQYYLGLYTSAEEAARAYDQAALELFGEHAKLNFPQERVNAK